MIMSTVLIAGTIDEATIDRIHGLFPTWLAGLRSFPIDLPFTAYRRALNARKELASVLHDHVEEIKAKPKDKSILSSLLEENELGRAFTNEEVVDTFLTMVIG